MMLKKEFYDMRLRTFVILFLGIGLFFTLAPLQNITVEMLKQYSQAENLPKSLEKFFPKGIVENLSDWNFYIYSQWFGKNLGQMIPILAIIMAFPLFSRENENGTIEFLLARRSRKEIFLSKSLLASFVLFSQMIVFSLLPGIYSLVANKDLAYRYLPAFVVHTVVGAFFWFSVTLFLSVLSSDQVKPILISFGLLAATTVAGMIKPLRFLNTYSYILGSEIFQSGKMNLPYTSGLLCITVVLFVISYFTFLKREY